jgi:hypothetical protein
MFSKRYQSDPVALNCFFFKKTLPGHHVIEIEELKMSKKGYCVVRACIKQQQDLKPLNSINDYNPQDWTTTVHGLFTMGNMDNEEGVTYFTRPATFPNEEHLEPFQYNFMGQFLESKLDTRVFPPSDEKEGIPEETHTMKFSDGRPVDFKSIPYWCDMFITPPFLLGPKILGGPVWCPTMQLEVQFKKKPTGHEIKAHFLARHIINGRFDVDGEVYNEQNELLALTR